MPSCRSVPQVIMHHNADARLLGNHLLLQQGIGPSTGIELHCRAHLASLVILRPRQHSSWAHVGRDPLGIVVHHDLNRKTVSKLFKVVITVPVKWLRRAACVLHMHMPVWHQHIVFTKKCVQGTSEFRRVKDLPKFWQ